MPLSVTSNSGLAGSRSILGRTRHTYTQTMSGSARPERPSSEPSPPPASGYYPSATLEGSPQKSGSADT